MIMDQEFDEFLIPINGFRYEDQIDLPGFDKSKNPAYKFEFNHDPFPIDFFTDQPIMFPPSSSQSNSPTEEHDSDPVLKYINQILLEEDMEDKPSMFHDPLALEETEKSLYDVIGKKYPPSPIHIYQNIESPDYDYSNGFGSENSTSSGGGSSSSSGSNLSSNFQTDSMFTSNSIHDMFNNSESIALFKRGMEEANRFLPTENRLVIDLDKYNLPPKAEAPAATLAEGVKPEKKEENQLFINVDKYNFPDMATPATAIGLKLEKKEENGSRRRKHHHDFEDEQMGRNKQAAVYPDDSELSEMFDRVLLFTDSNGQPVCCHEIDYESLEEEEEQPRLRYKKPENTSAHELAVDLRNLLLSCSQSIAAYDLRTANEQLKQIRQQSSPTGNVSHRLANMFANGLEARLASTGSQIYAASAAKRISAAEKLKAYQVFFSACPFKKISIFFGTRTLLDLAAGAKTLHIIDFGIQYGFQWPILIQHLASLPGGPPKLRITGIENPQPGFRPAELIEETGRRLAKYCERFNVQFEYNAIATKNWDTIKLEDLKIKPDEKVAVNTLFRFKNLLDETVIIDSPRDGVLKLIKQINPSVFIQAIVNGSFNAPFFVTRFREALFHYSTVLDMFDATLPRDSRQRLNFEKEFIGREAINVIACEGAERVERPETYKQWQVRNMRAGFRVLPLDRDLMKKLRVKAKVGYHQDFLFDDDGHWLLQGWKGRIMYASSCWVPA